MKNIIVKSIIGLSLVSSIGSAKATADLHIGVSQQSVLNKDINMVTIGWGAQGISSKDFMYGVSIDYQMGKADIGVANTSEDVGGIATDFKLGYQPIQDLLVYGIASVQYHAFEGAYSAAIGYGGGAGIEYSISKHFAASVKYKTHSMETTTDVKYTSSGVGMNLKYKF